MATAIYQYFGILSCMDCSEDMIYSGVAGFVAGVSITLLAVMIYRDKN